MHLDEEDQQMLQAFQNMKFMWEPFRKDDDRDHKKKRVMHDQSQGPADANVAMQMLKAMGTLMLRLDAEQQQIKKQDSWICYMQTESKAILS